MVGCSELIVARSIPQDSDGESPASSQHSIKTNRLTIRILIRTAMPDLMPIFMIAEPLFVSVHSLCVTHDSSKLE